MFERLEGREILPSPRSATSKSSGPKFLGRRKASRGDSELESSVKFLKGVGEKLATLFAKKEVLTIRQALYFLPRTYEDRRQISSVRDAPLGVAASVMGRIVRSYPVRYSRSRRSAYELLLEDLDRPEAKMVAKWFHKPHLLQKLEPGHRVLITGKTRLYGARKEMVHPELELLGKEDESLGEPKIVPVYSQTEGLYPKSLRKILSNAVHQYASLLEDVLPTEIRERYGFPTLSDAIRFLHSPEQDVNFEKLLQFQTPAQQRMIYEEFFLFSLALAQIRRDFTDRAGIAFRKPEKSWELFGQRLGFRFTSAQRHALKEILEDMQSDRVMYRLLQGDVGSGKTAVSAAASLIALESGYQVAFMAPTEVLVEQHFKKFKHWFQDLEFPVLKLTGSSTGLERREISEILKSSQPSLVVGTHALFEDPVSFSKLGLVIVDEQHRFGVKQRARLVAKGASPDLLIMTATPIPRTLALTIYGDLDVSTISELPPGRKPIETKLFSESQRDGLVSLVREQLSQGRQAYVIFPLIENSEALAVKSIESMLPEIEKDYHGFCVGVLHGRLDPQVKNQILEDFAQGRIQVLVSTTVIEVGVDVPNASVMVIEAAERFGLSQLHQLRGRVGRGAHQSFCYLVNSHWLSSESLQRLRALERIQDGFKLSELDLEWRGAGELAGTRQTGLPEFSLGQLPRDLQVFQKAREDAFAWVAQDPLLVKSSALQKAFSEKLERLRRT